MSSIAQLVSSIKANTESVRRNTLVLGKKRSNSETSKKENVKKLKTNDQTNSGPTVVVFDGSALNKAPVMESKTERKAFMSSKIVKPQAEEVAPKRVDAKEQAEEEQHKRHDKELNDLLATTKLLEEYQVDEMTGKERRSHMMSKLEKLGVKSKVKEKRSLNMFLGMEAKRKEREQKKLQEAKDLGLYDKSLKHLYEAASKPKQRPRDRGINSGVGKMKGATLHISQREMHKLESQGSKRQGSRRRK